MQSVKIIGIAFLCIVLLALPFISAYVMSVLQVRLNPTLSPGWVDNSFNTEYSNPGWTETNFSTGWAVNWTLGQSTANSYGFIGSGSGADLYANFNGSLSGICIKRSLSVDTSSYPFLVINYSCSSSNPALMFSFGLTDTSGNWHDGGWYHVSNSWGFLAVNLADVYSGVVTALDLRLTNDFNHSYAGGEQHAYIQSVGFYGEPPDWVKSQNEPVNSSILDTKDGLNITVSGDVTAGTIVSAQRSELAVNITEDNYLSVSIKTSSVNVAARIIIWQNNSSYPVLIKTYDDSAWHNEVIDLSSFNLAGNVSLIELSLQQLTDGNYSSVCYRQLAFNTLGGVY
jgi:hypothetical protein